MKLLPGKVLAQGKSESQVIKLRKNICGQKQVVGVWNAHLYVGLSKIGFEKSTTDECLYIKDDIIFMVYMDDEIILAKKNSAIDRIITELKKS